MSEWPFGLVVMTMFISTKLLNIQPNVHNNKSTAVTLVSVPLLNDSINTKVKSLSWSLRYHKSLKTFCQVMLWEFSSLWVFQLEMMETSFHLVSTTGSRFTCT